ncbi:DUF305 domain-containing protein [Mycetocola zhadangensis]|uniref:DUF305 domain-containing protein n=1 Tax=Mycetocola zhadangensis TaxID=1164595 RepID=A0A3L7ISB4_9MICO|nr:DUF305 domain-containing protein [Mycetocola zhadangensis]RLQ80980.1 DUF305 domain-containing protein [Mycetocola zhadangensis]GGF03668.1 hypothetical protein GCM10011313_28470 [Mycetocola zhadangensis]
MTATGTPDFETDASASASTSAPVSRRRSPLALLLLALVAVVVVGIVAFSVGRLSTLGDPTPTTDSAEAGFARDMQTHHNQGVELSMIIRDLTDDDAVRLLAYDIATTQGAQSGMMQGWLAVWGLPAHGTDPEMTWMMQPTLEGDGHNHGSGESAHEPGEPMPGLATSEQITELKSLRGVAAERMFLELMIAHHQGAIDMAEAVLDRSTNSTVRTFANGVVKSQDSEIDLMESMLEERPAP